MKCTEDIARMAVLIIGHSQKNDAVKNVFLTLHGHKINCQQRELSKKFLMRYQQFASHAYCGAEG
jgi:hypothetical protein